MNKAQERTPVVTVSPILISILEERFLSQCSVISLTPFWSYDNPRRAAPPRPLPGLHFRPSTEPMSAIPDWWPLALRQLNLYFVGWRKDLTILACIVTTRHGLCCSSWAISPQDKHLNRPGHMRLDTHAYIDYKYEARFRLKLALFFFEEVTVWIYVPATWWRGTAPFSISRPKS